MTYRLANVAGRAALVHGDHYFDLHHLAGGDVGVDPMDALADPSMLHELAATLGQREPSGTIATAVLGPPVPRPAQVFAIGLNYADHAAESQMDEPTAPVVFTKFPTCISGPGAPIEIHNDTIDYEAELVVVIGTDCRDVPAERAWDHIAGITAGQDVSDRGLQFAAKPAHFDLGKSRHGFGPIGPYVVSVDALDDPDDIEVSCVVNGETRQRSSSANLIFSVPALMEYLSSILTLRTGDLIFTGTPAGVGITTGHLLRPGDIVETRVGEMLMTNPCIAPTGPG